MTEDSGVRISDSVVMGDVKQNITNIQQHIGSSISCTRCDAINVRIFGCSSPDCKNHFCEVCHPNCKWTEEGADRFDSEGHGPFCGHCMDLQLLQWELDEASLQMSMRKREAVFPLLFIAFIGVVGIGTSGSILSSALLNPMTLLIFGGLQFFMLVRYLVGRNAYLRAYRNMP